MQEKTNNTQIVYRCPDCGNAVFGIVGDFTFSYGMIRLKCNCQSSYADIVPVGENKLKFSIPCPLCKQNHTYTLASSIVKNRESFSFDCPYSNMSIAYVGAPDKINALMDENEKQLTKLLSDLELSTLSDIQPEEMSDAEILPDASLFDALRLVLSELEYDKKADCPCHKGHYDIRYTEAGLQAFCDECGATYDFDCKNALAIEDILNLDEIKLS